MVFHPEHPEHCPEQDEQMPIGFSAKCKACNSPQRAEIDRRLLAGESTRSVAEWLQREHGLSVGHVGLANHKGAHLDVVGEAASRIAAVTAPAIPVFEAAVEKVIADASLLDELAGIGMRVARNLEAAMEDPSTAQATAFGHAMKEARGAVVDKHELLHGKKLNVDVSDPGAEDLHAKLAALVGGAGITTDAGTAGDAES